MTPNIQNLIDVSEICAPIFASFSLTQPKCYASAPLNISPNGISFMGDFFYEVDDKYMYFNTLIYLQREGKEDLVLMRGETEEGDIDTIFVKKD